MKYLITIWILSHALFFVSLAKAEACQLSIPESYVPTFLAPPVSGHYVRCDERPEEPCHCIDDVDPWASVIIDEVDDIGIYTGKKLLRHSPVKKAAKEAKKQTEKDAELSSKAAKKALKQSVKNDIKEANTVAKLRALVEKLIEAQE